jgi:hypothetical protein
MPANPNAPFGFRFIKMIDGTVPNYGTRQGKLISTNTHQIFSGDTLLPSVAGYLDVASTPSTGITLGGIVDSFAWTSISLQQTVRRLWWPGNGDASGDVTVYYYSNPGCIFEVQATLGPITQANVGQYFNYAVGSGGRTVGSGTFSSFSLTGSGTDTQGTLPFRVYNLPTDTTQNALFTQSGYDATQPYNRVWVTMVNLTPE